MTFLQIADRGLRLTYFVSAVDHRSDLFSLGVVVFEMIDGRRPFHAQTAIETLNAILTMPAPSLRAVTGGSPLAAGRKAAR